MDHGADTDAVPVPPAGDEAAEHAAPGRIPLAVVVWTAKASSRTGAVVPGGCSARPGRTRSGGPPSICSPSPAPCPRPAGETRTRRTTDSVPASRHRSTGGCPTRPRDGPASSCPRAGEAPRRPGPARDGTERMCCGGPTRCGARTRTAPGAGRRRGRAAPGRRSGGRVHRPGIRPAHRVPGAEELARRLPEIMPSMSVGESARIVAQVLELGYPALEFSRHDRVPVTPDWGVPRRAERRARRAEAARVAASGRPVPEDLLHDGEDLEYVAVRERLEFLNEVSGRIGTSLDLAQTIIEVSRAVVPRFTDVAGTYLENRSSPARGSPRECRTRPPCGTGSPWSTPTSRAAGTTSCRSARPCRSRRTHPSSSA